MSRTPAAEKAGERGAAVVEFALVLPIFLAVVATVVFAGWLGLVRTIVDRGAVAGARFASIPTSQDLRTWPDEARVFEAVDAATPLVTPTAVRLSSSVPGRNSPLEVEVTYRVPNPAAALMAPLRALGVGEAVPEAVTVIARSEVRRE